MKKLIAALAILVVLVIAGGIVVLGTWDMPPPTQQVEKELSNDRLSR